METPTDTSQYDNLIHEIKLTAMLIQYNNYKGKQTITDYTSLKNLHIKIDNINNINNDIEFLSSVSDILKQICNLLYAFGRLKKQKSDHSATVNSDEEDSIRYMNNFLKLNKLL